MRKNMKKVLDAFRVSKPAKGDSRKTCWTDGTHVYSYAACIGTRNPDGTVTVHYDTRRSVTTNSHIRALEFAISQGEV